MADEQMKQYMPAAFRVAVRTLNAWGYSADEMARVLALNPAQFQRYRATGLPEETANSDLITRVSLVLGIERALKLLLAEESDIQNWLNRPSKAPLFKKATPKSIMMNGQLGEIRKIHKYLDGWLNGDFA